MFNWVKELCNGMIFGGYFLQTILQRKKKKKLTMRVAGRDISNDFYQLFFLLFVGI